MEDINDLQDLQCVNFMLQTVDIALVLILEWKWNKNDPYFIFSMALCQLIMIVYNYPNELKCLIASGESIIVYYRRKSIIFFY